MMLKRSPAAAGPTRNDSGLRQPLRLLCGSLLSLFGLALLFAAAPSGHAQERLDGLAPVAPPAAAAAPADGAPGTLPGVVAADGASGAVPAVYRSLPPAF